MQDLNLNLATISLRLKLTSPEKHKNKFFSECNERKIKSKDKIEISKKSFVFKFFYYLKNKGYYVMRIILGTVVVKVFKVSSSTALENNVNWENFVHFL